MDTKLRVRLVNAITEYDKRQADKKFYNPYALGLYFKALARLEKYLAAGYDLRVSLLNTFNGRLLDLMLKTCNLPKSTKAETFVGGFEQLPEIED
jgi:hypothetical protein